MKALILAGGLGTRLRPITYTIPKPMVEVGGKPFLWHQLKLLESLGIKDIILSTGYLGDQIQSYFSDGSDLGIKITYSHETEPLGSGGAVYQCRDLLKENFILLNGDDLPVVNWKKLAESIKSFDKNLLLIFKSPGSGNLVLDEKNKKIDKYLGVGRTESSNWVHAGLSYLTPDIFELFSKDKGSIEENVFTKLASSGRLYYFKADDITLSIGNHETLAIVRKKLPDYIASYINEK